MPISLFKWGRSKVKKRNWDSHLLSVGQHVPGGCCLWGSVGSRGRLEQAARDRVHQDAGGHSAADRGGADGGLGWDGGLGC